MNKAAAAALVAFATFTDIVAYSVAVPVLPDLGIRLGASPSTIGLLFAAFGVTLLTVSIPMGSVSDRVGRRLPLVGGLVALALSTLLFAFAEGLPWLFAARLAQGAADAVTWVVGFALIADLYGPEERGRVMGMVMSATTFGLMVGPSLGGWLYERGGARVPYLAVSALALVSAGTFLWLRMPAAHSGEPISVRLAIRVPAVRACVGAVVLVAATVTMLEPVMSMWLASTIGLTPARVGLVFGSAAAAGLVLHPIYGGLADRWGGRRLTLTGLIVMALLLPLVPLGWSFRSAAGIYIVAIAGIGLVITPSLAYMGESMSAAGVESFGVAYGFYNVAWGVGLLVGPAVGGVLYERIGFQSLTVCWSLVAMAVTTIIARVGRASLASAL